MSVTYDDYLKYRRGDADEELSARVEEALADEQSSLRQFLTEITARAREDVIPETTTGDEPDTGGK